MVALILVAQLLGGCSFVLVSGPPANHRQLPVVECTSSRVGPVLDTVWTLLQVLNFTNVASRTEGEWEEQWDGEPPFSRGAALPLYATLAALGGAGMYFGYSRTAACRSAKSELMIRAMSGPQHAPGTWPPPQPVGPAAPAPMPAPAPAPMPAPAPAPAPEPAPAPAPAPTP
jgi:hypothetical protein